MADGTQYAWLVESAENGAPVYFQLVHDDDWTRDHAKALRLARRQDAEAVIAYYGWTEAKAVEHGWD